MPIIMRIDELLPDPFGPSSPNIVPGSMRNVSPSTATLVSYALRMWLSSTMAMSFLQV